MTKITTRKHFVEIRNSFFSALNELHRQIPHVNRVASLSASGANAANRQSEADQHLDKIKEMTADYDALRGISAMSAPTQDDFDRAEAIARKWNVYA